MTGLFHAGSKDACTPDIVLHSQNTLSYRRAGNDTFGYHKINVKIVGWPGLKAHYREGYYLFQP